MILPGSGTWIRTNNRNRALSVPTFPQVQPVTRGRLSCLWWYQAWHFDHRPWKQHATFYLYFDSNCSGRIQKRHWRKLFFSLVMPALATHGLFPQGLSPCSSISNFYPWQLQKNPNLHTLPPELYHPPLPQNLPRAQIALKSTLTH